MFAEWGPRVRDLCDRIRQAARGALLEAVARGDLSPLRLAVAQGASDVTYGIDEPAEAVLSQWFAEWAAVGPLSVFSEDAGWRHRGPEGVLPGFDHGGPRIVVDPIDGTRALFADLRPAWTVVGVAGAGADLPRQSELVGGVVAELPTSRGAVARILVATPGGGCSLETLTLAGGTSGPRPLRVDADDRVDAGYFPFFRYTPSLRLVTARLEERVHRRLAELEGADVATCFDDQYLSNAGQLVLLALGTYRCIVDPRATLAARLGLDVVTSKPYDVSAAVLCAQEAGCVVTTPEGDPLEFPLDGHTAVSFAGFANEATAARMAPHLQAALNEPLTRS